ncbi:MAG: hypothetical protein IKB16_02110 [Lentisphaeria bacterium]|nr:hypothetical protein [Lentisphaeria bacterium]
MPTSYIHNAVTRELFSLLSFDLGDNTGLINEYCCYPDLYFSGDEKYKPYNFFTDGVQFHYLPDTPYRELYRYWSAEGGKVHRMKPYVNENFIHAKAGFEFFLEHIITQFRAGNMEEGKKYLGSLLHMLQDSTFGLHSIEGPGGMDMFVLDRLMESEVQPTLFALNIDAQGKNLKPSAYIPQILGDSVGDTVMRLYAEYYRRTSDSRKCTFQYILNARDKQESGNPALVQRMFDNAVQICADVVNTIYHIVHGTATGKPVCSLTEFEPYEFPFGGGGGAYRFLPYVRNQVYLPDGTVKEIDGVSFGSHFEGALRYWIAPGVFRLFAANLKLYCKSGTTENVCISVLNDGKVAQRIVLDAVHSSVQLELSEPANELSFVMESSPVCGVIALENSRLSR